MLLKILLFILIAYFVIKFLYRPRKKSFTEPKQNFNTPNQGGAIETLLSCPVCGTFFQNAQGVTKNEKIYCSEHCASKNKT